MADRGVQQRAGMTFEAHRDELLIHCYRMLGSYHEAEDMVQETFLRAWRSRERYDAERASMRTWLYKIATNVCLTWLEGRSRRALPSGLGAPSEDPSAPLTPRFDIPWLQPFPTDPTARYGDLRLAFVAALQTLPALQRAALILREVLEFSAAEVAAVLDTSPAAVNSALQRARGTLRRSSLALEAVPEPDDPGVVAVVGEYLRAFEAGDVTALAKLLDDDVRMEMPPVPLWYVGRDHYLAFLTRIFGARGSRWRMRPLVANGQPAAAAYCPDDGGFRLHTVQVFTVVPPVVVEKVVFADPQVFAAFGLPLELP